MSGLSDDELDQLAGTIAISDVVVKRTAQAMLDEIRRLRRELALLEGQETFD